MNRNLKLNVAGCMSSVPLIVEKEDLHKAYSIFSLT